MIRITSKQEGFRRAGIAHTVSPREYPNDKFNPEQLKALKAEPMLVVAEIPDEGGEDLNALTIAQLTEEIAKHQPVEPLKGVRKAELIEILKAHREKK